MARQRELSTRQTRILSFIAEQIEEQGYPPTIREIGGTVGISSTSVVNYHLNKLQERGLIERDDRVSRGLKLTDAVRDVIDVPQSRQEASATALNVVRIPLLGQIAAGRPIDVPTDPDPEDYVTVSSEVVGAGGDVFAVHVKGDSMIDALIHDGDIVVLQHADTADNGEMVAAWIKDREETTLKRIYQEGKRVRLQPDNPTMDAFYEPADNVQVQGKVIAVIRNVAAARPAV